MRNISCAVGADIDEVKRVIRNGFRNIEIQIDSQLTLIRGIELLTSVCELRSSLDSVTLRLSPTILGWYVENIGEMDTRKGFMDYITSMIDCTYGVLGIKTQLLFNTALDSKDILSNNLNELNMDKTVEWLKEIGNKYPGVKLIIEKVNERMLHKEQSAYDLVNCLERKGVFYLNTSIDVVGKIIEYNEFYNEGVGEPLTITDFIGEEVFKCGYIRVKESPDDKTYKDIYYTVVELQNNGSKKIAVIDTSNLESRDISIDRSKKEKDKYKGMLPF